MFSDDIFDSVTALENHEITFEDFKKTMMTIIKNHRKNKDMYLNIRWDTVIEYVRNKDIVSLNKVRMILDTPFEFKDEYWNLNYDEVTFELSEELKKMNTDKSDVTQLKTENQNLKDEVKILIDTIDENIMHYEILKDQKIALELENFKLEKYKKKYDELLKLVEDFKIGIK